MKITQYTTRCEAGQFSRWGAIFKCAADAASACARLAQSEYIPKGTDFQQIEHIVLFECGIADRVFIALDAYESDSEIKSGMFWTILFISPEQAQQACEAIRWTVQKDQEDDQVVCIDNQVIFDCGLEDHTVFYAITIIAGIKEDDFAFVGSFCWIPAPFEEDLFSLKPSLHIVDVAAGEMGVIRSVWIEADKDPCQLMQEITWWLSLSPVKGTENWDIVNAAYFPPYVDASIEAVEQICYIAQMWVAHELSWYVYWQRFKLDKKAPKFESDEIEFCGVFGNALNFFEKAYHAVCDDNQEERSVEGFHEFYCFEQQFYQLITYKGDCYIYHVVE